MKKTRSRTLLGVLGLLLAAVLVLCTMGLFAGCGEDEEPVEGGGDGGTVEGGGDDGAVTYSLNVFAGGFGMNFFVGGTVTTNNINVEVVPSDNSGNIDIKAGDGKDDFVIYDKDGKSNSDGSVTVTSDNFTVYVEYTGEKYDFGTNSKVGSLDISEYIHYGESIEIVPAKYSISSGYGDVVTTESTASDVTALLKYIDGTATKYSDKANIDVHVQHYGEDDTLLEASDDEDYDSFTAGVNAIVATSSLLDKDGNELGATLIIYIDSTSSKVYVGSDATTGTEYDLSAAPTPSM